MTKIRVLVVDDHSIVREGVSSLPEAEPNIEVVDEAGSGEEALEKARRLRPDVVVMDIAMPGLSGFDATRIIKREIPGVEIIALTVHEHEDYSFRMLLAGASGYVVKGAASKDLIAAVRAAYRGEVFLYPSGRKIGCGLREARERGERGP